jgi:iron complex outermembrane receptor protein
MNGMTKTRGAFLFSMFLLAVAAAGRPAHAELGDVEDTGEGYSETIEESFPKRELLFFEEIPIVISATKSEQPITESPSSISVITSEDIRRSSATNIADLLRRVPGIDVLRISPSDVNVSARGFNESNNNDMLLLIDGRSAYVDFFGIVVWDDLPIVLEEIERIEIIRGPGSALYGANAFSGVINIITKTPEQAKGTTLSATVGEFDTFRWTVMNADVFDKWGYKVVASWDEANSFEDRDKDDNDSFTGSVLAQYEFDADSLIRFSVGVNEGDGNTLTRTAPFDRDGTLGYAQINYDYRNWKFQGFYNLVDIDVVATDGEERSIVNNVFDLEMQHSFALWEDHMVTWGANYRHDRVTSHEIIGEKEQDDLFSLFVQDQFRMQEGMTLTTGVRFDSHPLTGVHLSPRASLVYEPRENHIFRASISRAFRNPSLVESYLDLNILLSPAPPITLSSLGNRDLDAEEVTSFELGYQARLLDSRLHLKADAFYNLLDEIIEFRHDTPLVLEFKNVGKATAYGGEVGVEYHFSERLSAYFNYSYQLLKARDDGVQFQLNEDGDTIDSSPEHKINAGVYAEHESGLNGSIDLNYVDETAVGFFDSSSTPLPFQPRVVELDDYTRIDARIGYKFRDPEIEVSLIFQNAFDDEHREHPLGELLQRQVFFQVYGRF